MEIGEDDIMFQVNQIYYMNGKSNSTKFGKTGRYGIAFGNTRTIDVADTLDDARRLAGKYLKAYNTHNPHLIPNVIYIQRNEGNASIIIGSNGYEGMYYYKSVARCFNLKTGKLV